MIDIFRDIAAEPEVRALIISGAFLGRSSFVDVFLNYRDDYVFIVYIEAFDREEEIAERADLVIQTNRSMFGHYYVKQANKMGAETIINYTNVTLSEMRQPENIMSRDMMKEAAERKGINFVEVDVPDWREDIWIAQQYVAEDVLKQISVFGANTAFFSPANVFQLPIISQIVNESVGGLFPASNRPSPLGEVGQVFGISGLQGRFPLRNRHNVYGVRWDIRTYQELIRVIREEAVRLGATGRVSLWPMDPADFYNALAFEYAVRWINGEVDGEGVDLDLLAEIGREIIMEEIGEPVGVSLERHPDFPNFILAMMDFIVF
jgi:hypothetical protein